ncbi:unnamed protein product [Microthlaspi erraticum]|uniref:DUF4283 domain-containing protein n=1 Tax=Microthlaspi erraticum TaxID=1685480 RepID=A0A6D2I7V5_9BRAS|nr:unnamed protein product [Microthlaspi erraticum]
MNPQRQDVKYLITTFPRVWKMENCVTGDDLGGGRFQFDFDEEDDIIEKTVRPRKLSQAHFPKPAAAQLRSRNEASSPVPLGLKSEELRSLFSGLPLQSDVFVSLSDGAFVAVEICFHLTSGTSADYGSCSDESCRAFEDGDLVSFLQPPGSDVSHSEPLSPPCEYSSGKAGASSKTSRSTGVLVLFLLYIWIFNVLDLLHGVVASSHHHLCRLNGTLFLLAVQPLSSTLH